MRAIKNKIRKVPKWKLYLLVIIDAIYSFTVYVHEEIGILPFDELTNFYIKIVIGIIMTISNLILLANGKHNQKDQHTQ